MADIMIVDDDRDIVALLKFLLENDGHRITTACNGGEALTQLGVEPPRPDAEIPDLIVLDVMMPVMDGYTVCSRLAKNGRMRSVPLVILTAKGEMHDLFQTSTNVADCLEKPFDPKTLRELIAGILAKKK